MSPVAQTLAAEIKDAPAAASPTVAQDIARWVVDLRYEELPADVIARAKRVLLDSVGCILGAIGAEPVRVAQKVVVDQNAAIFGRDQVRASTADQSAVAHASAKLLSLCPARFDR